RLAGGSAEMHRDICVTNREAIVRWMGTAIEDMLTMRDLIASGTDESFDELLGIFESARDARASWATAERREGELVQKTGAELTNVSMTGQFNQMLFGSMLRRKPRIGNESSDDRRNGRS